MKSSRILALAVLTVVAAGAQAVPFFIDVVSIGTAVPAANVTFTEKVFFQSTSIPMPVFNDHVYSIVNNLPPVAGAGVLSDAAVANTLTYSGDP